MPQNKLRIIIAADHAGFTTKESIKKYLVEKGLEIFDVGAHELVPEDDYPVYMTVAAMKVSEDMSGETKAILFGGSGQGEAMVANRFPGVRAAVWYGGKNEDENLDIIKLSRSHNDSNILSIGARFVNEKEVVKAIESWLKTPFNGEEKYARRIAQMDSME